MALDVVGHLWRARGAEFRGNPEAQTAAEETVCKSSPLAKSTALNVHVLRAVVLQVRAPGGELLQANVCSASQELGSLHASRGKYKAAMITYGEVVTRPSVLSSDFCSLGDNGERVVSIGGVTCACTQGFRDLKTRLGEKHPITAKVGSPKTDVRVIV